MGNAGEYPYRYMRGGTPYPSYTGVETPHPSPTPTFHPSLLVTAVWMLTFAEGGLGGGGGGDGRFGERR